MMTNSYVIIKAPTAEEVEPVINSVKTLSTVAADVLFSLTAKDRQRLNKAAEKTESFVNKGLFYILNNPDYCPTDLNQGLMKVDAETIAVLMPLQKMLAEMLGKVTDTITIAKSEQLRGVRKYYKSISQAAKENDPGAKTIYDDMCKRYKGQGRKKSKPEEDSSKTKDSDLV